MKSKKLMILLLGPLFLVSFAYFCSSEEDVVTLLDIDISGSPNGIVPLPENTPSIITDVFSKYTKIIAPNGKPIHFLAQDGWTDDKLLRARNVMEHFLTDYPGSIYGSNKAAIANAMADSKATMTLYNTSPSREESKRFRSGTDLSTQGLWAIETTAEGSNDYMNHITRDASYEEILHLVQRSIRSVMPEFEAKIAIAAKALVARGVWDDGKQNNPSEYFAQQLDNYIDLWAVYPKLYGGRDVQEFYNERVGPGKIPEGTAHHRQNKANSRARLLETDPAGYELVTNFFHPYLTYTPELPEKFEGTFSIEFDESLVYTYKSQHLKNVILKGSNDANLTGNAYDNVLTGNAGTNILKGGAGDDRLVGGNGDDTAVFSGAYADYSITNNNGNFTVKDKRLNRDGNDTLTSIEFLQFGD